MTLLKSSEIRQIERRYSFGIRSATIVSIFRNKGERFSAATLRKYVQVGLLTKSKRVGVKGRHRGSSGLYPVYVVGMINEIKRALDKSATLDEIRLGPVGIMGELKALQKNVDMVANRFSESFTWLPKNNVKRKQRHRVGLEFRTIRKAIGHLGNMTEKIGQPDLQEKEIL